LGKLNLLNDRLNKNQMKAKEEWKSLSSVVRFFQTSKPRVSLGYFFDHLEKNITFQKRPR
jgi:hypothetical protein